MFVVTVLGQAMAAPVPDLTRPPAGTVQDGGHDVALVVGISDYAYLPDIPGAAETASDWASYLSARGVRQVRLLTDWNASAPRIRAAAAQLSALRGPNGRSWLVFVGHGAPRRAGDGVLVAADARGSVESIETDSVTVDEAVALLSGSGPPTVAVVDASFSVPAEPTVCPGCPVLFACSPTEYAGALPRLDRPAFSWLVLGALRGWGDADGDGRVTAGEAVDYAQEQIMRFVATRTQTPQLHGDAGIVLSTGKERAPALERSIGRPAAR